MTRTLKKNIVFMWGLCFATAFSNHYAQAGRPIEDEDPIIPQAITSVANKLSLSALFENSEDGQEAEIPVQIDFPFIKSDMDIGQLLENGDYALNHNARLTAVMLQQFVNKGYRLLNLIAQGKEVEHETTILTQLEPVNTRSWAAWAWSLVKKPTVSQEILKEKQPYFESLLSILWSLYDYSFKINQGFTRGSFSVIDEQGRLELFFENLLKALSDQENLESVPHVSFNVLWSKNPCVYTRPSSHYQNDSFYYADKQFGIDLYDPNNAILSLFPFGMQHFLYGVARNAENKKKIFLKTEPHGLGDFYSIMMHTIAFLGYPESTALEMRREKDLPEGVARTAHHFAQLFTDAFCSATDEGGDDCEVSFYPEESEEDIEVETDKENLKEEGDEKTRGRDSIDNDQLPELLRWYIAKHPRGTHEVFFKKTENIDLATLWGWSQYDYRAVCGEDQELNEKIREAQEDLKQAILTVYPKKEELLYRTGNEVVVPLSSFLSIPNTNEEPDFYL